ncbi:hypothetical protein NDU88_003274 [Pleurodeles waltl]|uniref:Uncharacterized protein n=1 Tax=Pleurodeles waltl TaxID=8319 RepID=A0AAV7NHR4_PLEWA|nr:hypothetical protein NDU88_003274 [Pleurodeles waltl]
MYEEDGRDAGGIHKKPDKKEVEGTTYDIEEDTDRACEGDVRGERKTLPKQDKEADIFENVEDTGQSLFSVLSSCFLRMGGDCENHEEDNTNKKEIDVEDYKEVKKRE